MKAQVHKKLADRLREIREDLYGEHGAQFMADALAITVETWLNYEAGVVLPAHVALELVVAAGVNPRWLLTGRGEKYALTNPKSSEQQRLG